MRGPGVLVLAEEEAEVRDGCLVVKLSRAWEWAFHHGTHYSCSGVHAGQ